MSCNAAVLGWACTLLGQSADIRQTPLVPESSSIHDRAAISIDLEGRTAVIGASRSGADSLFTRVGSVTIFGKPDSFWTELARFSSPGDTGENEFGISVALSGDTVLVGAHLDDEKGHFAGAAYVYVQGDSGWSEQQLLAPQEVAPFDRFGRHVALEGDTAVIVSRFRSADVGVTGAAYVFDRSGDTWTETTRLSIPSPSEGRIYVSEVAISAELIVVGANHDRRGVHDPGFVSNEAFIFERGETPWSHVETLIAGDASIDLTPTSVAIDGETVLVGSPRETSAADPETFSGSVSVYTRAGDQWTTETRLTASDMPGDNRFGGTVAIEGDTAVIGAIGDDDEGTQAGAAYHFERKAGRWSEVEKIKAIDPARGSLFGSAAAISGGRMLIAARRDNAQPQRRVEPDFLRRNDASDETGTGYLLERQNGVQTWTTLR